jgi:hypothetical protein
MLLKLIKYETKSSARIFLLLYAAMMVTAVITGFFGSIRMGSLNSASGTDPYAANVFTSLFTTLYGLLSLALIVVTVFIAVLRFYRMLGEEGYLWFTLPATATQHVTSKLLVALLWSFLSTIVLFLSVVLLAFAYNRTNVFEVIRDVLGIISKYGANPVLICTITSITLAVTLLRSILTFYAAMAIGPTFLKSRFGGSAVAYIIISVILSIVGTIVAAPFSAGFVSTLQNSYSSYISIQQAGSMANELFVVAFTPQIILGLASSIALFLCTNYFISKKLNLP